MDARPGSGQRFQKVTIGIVTSGVEELSTVDLFRSMD